MLSLLLMFYIFIFHFVFTVALGVSSFLLLKDLGYIKTDSETWWKTQKTDSSETSVVRESEVNDENITKGQQSMMNVKGR